MHSFKKALTLVSALMLAALVGCGGNVSGTPGSVAGMPEDAGFDDAAVQAVETPILDAEQEMTSSQSALSAGDGLVDIALTIPTSRGVVAANLWLSPQCLLKRDRRLVALVPGTLANGGGYYEVNIPGRPGYFAVSVLAKAGYCALSVDLPGTGGTYHPGPGQDIRTEDNAFAVAKAARPIASVLGISKWDVYGETGLGSNAVLLLAQRHDVRSATIASSFYRRFGPFSGQLFDPGFRAFVAVTPYQPLDAAFLAPFFFATLPDVQPAAIAATAGPVPQAIPTGVFNELAEIPFTFDPSAGEFVLDEPTIEAEPARAPALILQGSPDPVGSEAGTAELVAAYGATGGGTVSEITIPGATHLMRFDAVTSDGPSSPFWSSILSFLSAH